ncbi:MAG TPA: hypothetical protein VE754_01175 [Actinomycetota bacterium]|nr:hypothetical protein [Actinomycetota bacterium]
MHRVRPPAPRSPARRPARDARRIPFSLLVLCLVASLVVGLVAAQTFVAQDSFRLSELTRTTERLEEEYGRLRVRAAELSSPDRIVAAARRAGLVLPKQVEIVRLPPVRGRGDGDVRSEAPQTLALKGVTGGGP